MSGLGLTRSCLCETRVPEVTLRLRTSSSRAVPRGSLPSPPRPWGACWTQQSTWHQAPWGKARRGQPSSLGACDGPRCQTARPHGRQGQSMWTRGPDGNLGSPSGTTLARLVKPTRHQGRFAGCLSPTPVLSPGEGGAWWATGHGVAKSRTRLSDFTFTVFHFHSALDVNILSPARS